jgi:hypothetical protein
VTLDVEYAGRGKDLLEAGGVLIGDRVEIELDVQVVKAAASQAAENEDRREPWLPSRFSYPSATSCTARAGSPPVRSRA